VIRDQLNEKSALGQISFIPTVKACYFLTSICPVKPVCAIEKGITRQTGHFYAAGSISS
jgi:hypothetical protein